MTGLIHRFIQYGWFVVITVLTFNCEGGAELQTGENFSSESKLPDTFENEQVDPAAGKVVNFEKTAVEIPEQAFEKPVEIGMVELDEDRANFVTGKEALLVRPFVVAVRYQEDPTEAPDPSKPVRITINLGGKVQSFGLQGKGAQKGENKGKDQTYPAVQDEHSSAIKVRVLNPKTRQVMETFNESQLEVAGDYEAISFETEKLNGVFVVLTDAVDIIFNAKIVIDAGAVYTNQKKITLGIQANQADLMKIPLQEDCSDGHWEAYTTQSNLSLGSQKNKEVSVYAQFKHV